VLLVQKTSSNCAAKLSCIVTNRGRGYNLPALVECYDVAIPNDEDDQISWLCNLVMPMKKCD
jgi:hypothetical protein